MPSVAPTYQLGGSRGRPDLELQEPDRQALSPFVKEQLKTFNTSLLGKIEFDKDLEDSIGYVNKLLKTDFAQNIKKIVLNSPEFRSKKKL